MWIITVVSLNGLGQENARPRAFPAEADVVVCGGGPGGSTFATLMTRMGRTAVVFERATGIVVPEKTP